MYHGETAEGERGQGKSGCAGATVWAVFRQDMLCRTKFRYGTKSVGRDYAGVPTSHGKGTEFTIRLLSVKFVWINDDRLAFARCERERGGSPAPTMLNIRHHDIGMFNEPEVLSGDSVAWWNIFQRQIMNSKNMFAHKEIDVFYTRWFIRTLLFVVFIFMPLMIEHWIDVTTTEPISSKEAAARISYPLFLLAWLWVVIIENFKCIRIKCDRLKVELLPPRKSYQERYELYWKDVYQIKEHMIPIIGSVCTIRNKDGAFAGGIWIDRWKNGAVLKERLRQAAIANGGEFIPWPTMLLSAPKRFVRSACKFLAWLWRWLKNQTMPR